MRLRTFEILRQEKKNKKGRTEVDSKRIERRLEAELFGFLKDTLTTPDAAVQIEVINTAVLGEFIDMLDNGRTRMLYNYEQVSDTLFVFYNKSTSLL